jgi:hypothetical protein
MANFEASPGAQALASRLDALQANGHGWMDPALQVHLAQNGGSNQQMLDTAATYKNVIDNTGTGTTSAVADGAFNTPPNPLQKAASWLHNVHGPIPVLTSDITDIQKNLQAKGYGTGLDTGTWNPAWNQALNQHAQDALTAPGFGNVKSLPLWKKVLGDIAPSGWAPTVLHAVASYVHSLPDAGRQILADAAGNLGGQVETLISGKDFTGNRAKIVQSVESALGKKESVEQIKAATLQRTVGDFANIANLVLLRGGGKALYSAIGAIGKDTAASVAAQESVTSAAKALVTRSLPEEYAATPRFTVVKSLYQAGVDGQPGIGALRWMENIPVLKRMLPAIDAMDAQGSKYFTFKNAMAQSMRIPARQAVSQLQAKGSLTALGLLASSEAQKTAGGNQVFDATTAHPYSGILGNALDVAGLFAGAPTKGLSASQNAGQVVSGAHDILHTALGPIGIDVPIRKGLGISLQELQNNLGPEFVNDHFINTKLNQYSASHYANDLIMRDVASNKFDLNSKEAQVAFQQYEHDALNDPEILGPARESLLLQPTVLANYYKKDFANILGSNVRKGIKESYDVTDSDKQRFYDAMNRLKAAHEPMTTMLAPEHRNLFFGSSTLVKVQDAITKGLAEDWGKKVPDFDWITAESKTPKFMHINPTVNEYAPDANKLTSTTPYGSGVVATEDTGIAGRANANIYALRHTAGNTELPKFYDMSKKGSNTYINNAIRGYIKDNPLPKTPEVDNLRKILKNDLNFSGQDSITALRKALATTGKMDKDQIDSAVNQITQSMLEEKGYTGFHYFDKKYGKQTVINPDKAAAVMVKQDPAWTKESLIPSYLTHNNVINRGALGIARKETFVAQDAQRLAKNLFSEMSRLGHDGDVSAARSTLQLEEQQGLKDVPLPKFSKFDIGKNEAAVLQKARNVLITKLGYAPNEVTRFDPIQAISEIWRSSKSLASEAYLPIEAPKSVKDAVAKLDSLGYRPVLGTDIGHAYETPILHPAVVNQHTSMFRKAAMNLGFDTTKIGDLPVAQVRRTNVENEVNKLFANGKVQPILGDNGSSVYSSLLQGAQSGEIIKEGRLADAFRGAVEGFRGGAEGDFVDKELGDVSKVDYRDIQDKRAEARQKAKDIFNQAHTTRDLSLKEMVKVLTRPIDPNDKLGNLAPRYTKEDATKIAKAVLVGYAKTPASVVGLGKIEDFIRASGAMATNATASFFGSVPLLNKFKIGEGPIANTLAALPNDLARLRDKWRFDYSPIFAARRLTKTNVKAAAEGVPTTMNPYRSLERLGATDNAFATLQRTMPEVYRQSKQLEPLEKFLMQGDIFNIYNPAHMMAWQAHNLQQLGLSDAEITAKLTKINTYGERTPLERSVNTLFYPFSFNKTLYRSVGGYLLDHPGEAMLINAGFDLYHKMNLDDPNNGLGNWVKQHAPILDELKKLNAFDHGTGLGQFGGINAPYLNNFMNLFSPQSIKPDNAQQAIKAWTSALPALTELNGLLFGTQGTLNKPQGSAVETAKVGFWAAQNLLQHLGSLITGHKALPDHTTLTDQAQIQAGMDVSNQLKVQLANLIGTGYKWPDDPLIPKAVRNQPINATTIGQYAQTLYPAYDPSVGAALAMKRSSDAKMYVANLQGTFRYDAYSQFQKVADSAIGKLNKTHEPATIQNIVSPLREAAVNLAEQDSRFVSFYKKYYQSALGPIEGLTK